MTVRRYPPRGGCSQHFWNLSSASDGTVYISMPGVWRHRRKDGSIIFVEIMAFEFWLTATRRLILAIDVTERCRVLRQRLRESEASLKALVDNAPFGISAIVDRRRTASRLSILRCARC
jgi:PAS domain-containing protein